MGRSYRLNLDDFSVVIIEEVGDCKTTTAFRTAEDYLASVSPVVTNINLGEEINEVSRIGGPTRSTIFHTNEGIYEADSEGWYYNKGVPPTFLDPSTIVLTELRDKHISSSAEVHAFRWSMESACSDIIKFKLV